MKARNFDSVLLFKMGKFYEMFEMDAYVGVEVLGLMLMKVSRPASGSRRAGCLYAWSAHSITVPHAHC